MGENGLLSGLVCHCSLLNWSSDHRGANWRGITSTSLDGMLATDTDTFSWNNERPAPDEGLFFFFFSLDKMEQ